MGGKLAESDEIELANISQERLKSPIERNFGSIRQWLVPNEKLGRNGLPSSQTVKYIQDIISEYQPELIHVWGTENYWGILSARKLIPGPVLLEMQGLMYAYARVYYGGLNLFECIRCIGPKEIIRPDYSILYGKLRFEKWGKYEKEIIKGHNNISAQSEWVRSHVSHVNPGARIFKTGISLRSEFYKADAWKPCIKNNCSAPNIFTISSGATTYKGLHVLFGAIAVLKRKFPELRLNIAGNQVRPGIRKSGYTRWMEREIRRLGIKKHINWLGPLDAIGIIKGVQQASMVVIPSFIETYCVALAEAMILGAPVLVSYAGAMPELAKNEKTALFFPPGDEMACAQGMEQILNDREFAVRIGGSARRVALERNDPDINLMRQLEIYKSVLS
jgi:glycosyltransferase involved in cell wall biosynthesis